MNFSTLRLRPYQLEAQQAIVEARKRGFRAQLASLATGLGKSVIIATLPELLELRPGDVTLVVAHRDELIQQLVEKMKAQNPDAIVGVEKAEESAADDCTIVIATVQTLTGVRLNRFVTKFGRRIALFVIDEAHHAAAPTYRAILDKIQLKRPDVLVVGFTATPHRGDGVRLTEIFPDIVYSMDARQAIGAGYLVPVRSYAVATETNLDDVSSRGGDFVLGQLAEAVDTEERNRRVVEAYLTLTPGKKTLVFTASVEHARNVAQLFKDACVKAAFASGETPQTEREGIVAGFRGTGIDVLVNCGLYLEGFDVPSIQVIINARPTKSTTLYTQVTGRGLRPLDEYAYVLSELPSPDARRQVISMSEKPYAIIIDIVDQARRHQLVTLPTLWGLPAQIDAQGRPISEVAERYEELFRRAPREAARVRTAESIETALIELDEAAKPKANAVAAWQQIAPEHWRLERAPQRVARDRKGRPVPHFEEQLTRLVTMAKKIAPHEDAEGFALRLLDVDRRSIGQEATQIDVTRRGEHYVATLRNGKTPARDIGSAATLAEAIAAAQTRLQNGDLPVAAGRRPNGRRNGGARRFRGRRKRSPAAAG
ncbi:MAG TPA: DEAD/DEAH box helicase [Candidatus Baltobacteraceae bacterium]|nr:DEAD/DEAH box helicase [Candidatus Baltobacteraceae bacterium]